MCMVQEIPFLILNETTELCVTLLEIRVVFLLIVFNRWQLGIVETDSIFLLFTPKETDVSHFHKAYGLKTSLR